jgi:tetratricopeptide (TPR) repeat protein
MGMGYAYRYIHTDNIEDIAMPVLKAYNLLITKYPCKALAYLNWLQEARCELPHQQYDKAFNTFLDNLALAQQFDCKALQISTLLQVSSAVYERQQRYPEALQYKLKALRLADSLHISLRKIADITQEIGLLHYKVKNYQAALRFWHQTHQIYTHEDLHERTYTNNINNLGLAYRQLRQYDSAMYYFQQASHEAMFQRDTIWIGIARGNVGDILLAQKKYHAALPYLRYDLTQSMLYKEWGNVCLSMLAISQVYESQKQYDSARNILDSAVWVMKKYDLALHRNNEQQTMLLWKNICSQKATIFHATHQYDSAYYFKNLYALYSDSLQSLNPYETLLKQQGSFDMEKQRTINQLLAAESKHKANLLVASIAISVLLVIALGLGFNFYRVHKRQDNLAKEKLQLENDKMLALQTATQTQLKAEQEHHLRLAEQLRFQAEKAQLEQDNKEQELAAKQRELMMMSLLLSSKNEVLEQILDKLAEIGINEKAFPALKNIKSQINQSFRTEDEWQRFKVHFEAVHPNFYNNLTLKHADLSKTELQHCAFARMRLTTKQIADMLVQSKRTADTMRYRLRKTLNLSLDEDLVEYLQQF